MATEIYLMQIFYPFFFGSKEISLIIFFFCGVTKENFKKERRKKISYFHHFTLHLDKHITITLSYYYILKGTTSPKKSSIQKTQNPSNKFLKENEMEYVS